MSPPSLFLRFPEMFLVISWLFLCALASTGHCETNSRRGQVLVPFERQWQENLRRSCVVLCSLDFRGDVDGSKLPSVYIRVVEPKAGR